MIIDKCRHWLATANPRAAFLRNMQAARGFAANPKLLTGAFQRYRAAKAKRNDFRRDMRNKTFQMNVGKVGKVKTWGEMWAQTKEGTLIVWAPVIDFSRRWVMQPTRNRIIFPTQRFVARSRDRVTRGKAFVKSFFPTLPKAAPATPRASTSTSSTASSSSSTSLVAIVQERGRLMTQNASALGKHFREFLLDPNFKRRQLMYKMRQWQPETHAGRVMAPFAMAVVGFMIFSSFVWGIVSNTMVERERRGEQLKAMMLAERGDNLGLESDARRASGPRIGAKRVGIERDENDALLDMFTVRRWA